jgi:DNA-binding SARP family transcriptional activator
VHRSVQLGVLGGFRLTADALAAPLPPQAQRVVGLLAVRKTALSRSAVAAALWEDAPDRRAQANLRNALWRIHVACDALVRCTRDTVRVHECVVVDLAQAERVARDLVAGTPMRCGSPVGLLADDLLPEWDEEWLLIERERHRQLRLHALEELSGALRTAGRWSEAIAAALAAVQAEPLRESAQRALIEAHVDEGNVSEAVRQRDTYRRLLDYELGIPPSPRLEAIVDAALRGAPIPG